MTVNYEFRMTSKEEGLVLPGYRAADCTTGTLLRFLEGIVYPYFLQNSHNASVLQPIVLGPLSLEIFRKKRENYHSPPSDEEVNFVCS